MMSYANKIREEIKEIFAFAAEKKLVSVVIRAKELHELVIGPISEKNQCPNCCRIMREFKTDNDKVLQSSPSGDSSRLEIQYFFPRQ